MNINPTAAQVFVVLMRLEADTSRALLNDPLVEDHPVWRKLLKAYATQMDGMASAIMSGQSKRADRFATAAYELKSMLLSLEPLQKKVHHAAKNSAGLFQHVLTVVGGHSFPQTEEILAHGRAAKPRNVADGFSNTITALELHDYKQMSWSAIADLRLCGCPPDSAIHSSHDRCANNLKVAAYRLRKRLT